MQGLHVFTIAGIPVYVTFWYFLLVAWFGIGDSSIEEGLLWAACVTVSVLVHEFGHAMVARYFKLSPRVVLHGWGGFCAHDRSRRDRDDALIISAGPLAGILLGVVVVVTARTVEASVPDWFSSRPVAVGVYTNLVYINFFWSLVNLVPLWPLDGGQLFRLLMIRVLGNPARGERVTHVVGLALGIGLVLAAHFLVKSMMLAALAALMAFENFTRIGASSATGPIRRKNTFAGELLANAKAALERGDTREAARLCHQLRAETNLDEDVVLEMWRILGIASAHIGEWEDARSYLRRAKADEAVYRAQVSTALALEDATDARDLLARDEARSLSPELRVELEELGARGA